MSKRKYRKGGRISTLEELMRQDVVIVNRKTTVKAWFEQWKLFMAVELLERGMIFQAIPYEEEKE